VKRNQEAITQKYNEMPSTRMTIIISVDKEVEKLEYSYTAVEI